MFQTTVDIPNSELKISYESRILTLGSCFAQNIGTKLKEDYFETEINPFGVLYNPISIANSILLLLEKKVFTKEDIFQYNDLWQSFSHSSLFSDVSVDKCLEKISLPFKRNSEFIKLTDILLITFGTAWVYEEKKSGIVVSNCHKLPAKNFIRRRLTIDEIVKVYKSLIIKLAQLNPRIKIIFSVSPVRHWKDGAHENNISKSTLLLAIDELQKTNEQVYYFPAYEIQIDELRDYRFYSNDMFHPSEVAIDYIWKRFSETYFDDLTNKMKAEFEQFTNDLNHRPLFPDSNEFLKFQHNILKKKDLLKTKYPFLRDRLR